MSVAQNQLVDYIDDLRDAVDAETCLTITQRHVSRLGFQNVVFTYTKRPRNIEGVLPSYLRHSSIPKAWEERYREMGYQNHCPLYRESLRRSNLPMIWHDVINKSEFSPLLAQIADEAENSGLIDGISVPIVEPNGDRCGIGISTDAAKSEAKRLVNAHLPSIFLMSHHMHAFVVDRFVDHGSNDDVKSLTDSELRCLQWVTKGKSNWEISEILSVSENTIKYHVRNILTKMDVTNRTAAAAKAIRLGLIEP
ncbi:MAG: LuxR family transcriptional regulator [Rhodospirillaceae bacterium]|nr:LuxR family transcriptional regulator [Rhodospirillaceae bacterium]MBT5195033.1 LuxR family transcriptional regulator [Rhodospirillaceae bacterium]MBT7757637.1 LuxR family transcriptional regulator [Rhodospirillaceae bacterium]